jgi:hypothetical protein
MLQCKLHFRMGSNAAVIEAGISRLRHLGKLTCTCRPRPEPGRVPSGRSAFNRGDDHDTSAAPERSSPECFPF